MALGNPFVFQRPVDDLIDREAKLEAEPKTGPLPALHRLLELPREAYERTGHRVLVAFDEFHEVLRLDGLDGLIRSHVQHHGDAASYLFTGSKPRSWVCGPRLAEPHTARRNPGIPPERPT